MSFSKNLSMNMILNQWEKLKRKVWMKIILTFIGPFCSLFVLYYGDLFSDVLNMITLYRNCHFKYFAISFGILIVSYKKTYAKSKLHTRKLTNQYLNPDTNCNRRPFSQYNPNYSHFAKTNESKSGFKTTLRLMGGRSTSCS